MRRHLSRGCVVVDSDRRGGAQTVLRRDSNDGSRCLVKFIQYDGVIAQGWQKYDSLQPQLPEQGVHLLVDIGATDVHRFDHQVHVRFPASYDGTLLELAQVIARSIAEQPDEERSIARQPTRVEIGSVIELLDGLEDTLARIGT